MTTNQRPIALTGDRTTGSLHLGHLAGSLRRRVEIQTTHDQTILLADMQALTDAGHDTARLRANVVAVATDYLSVGIDPDLTTICVQSHLPALERLGSLYANLVSVARLQRNPTIRSEMEQKGMGAEVPAGFLCYPIAQAADITAFKATVVPCGEDQLPLIELSNEVVARINRIAGRDMLPRCEAMLSRTRRLPGIDGRAKASKSLGNAIPLSSTTAEIQTAVRAMYTDPHHLKVSDPGRVEGNVVFSHLSAFDPDHDEVDSLKEHYARGGLGDAVLKRRLVDVLEAVLAPIRERRAEILRRPDDVLDALRTGTARARIRTDATTAEVQEAMGLFAL